MLLLFASSALLVAACSGGGALQVDAPRPAGAAAQACRALSTLLPERLDGESRRELEPQSPFTAAWGDPAIVLRCGVARPAALRRTSELASVNGVDWFAEQLTAGYLFTSTGRVANVEVTVPDDYAPEVDPLVDLAGPIAQAVPPS